LKAKTNYRRRRIELIVERLEAEHKKLDIGIVVELEAERREAEQRGVERKEVEQREAERREVESSIEVVVKVGRIRLYSEVAEKVGQADPYVSNLLAFLEDSEVEAVAERIEVVGKLDTVIEVANVAEVAGKLDSQNSEVLDS
jgi:hypothetical protein